MPGIAQGPAVTGWDKLFRRDAFAQRGPHGNSGLGSYRRSQYSNEQARHHLASIYSRCWPDQGQGNLRKSEYSLRAARRRVNRRGSLANSRGVIDRDYMVEGDLRRGGCDSHQAPDGSWLLPWTSPPAPIARARPAHPHQRADSQGQGQAHRRQENKFKRSCSWRSPAK